MHNGRRHASLCDGTAQLRIRAVACLQAAVTARGMPSGTTYHVETRGVARGTKRGRARKTGRSTSLRCLRCVSRGCLCRACADVPRRQPPRQWHLPRTPRHPQRLSTRAPSSSTSRKLAAHRSGPSCPQCVPWRRVQCGSAACGKTTGRRRAQSPSRGHPCSLQCEHPRRRAPCAQVSCCLGADASCADCGTTSLGQGSARRGWQEPIEVQCRVPPHTRWAYTAATRVWRVAAGAAVVAVAVVVLAVAAANSAALARHARSHQRHPSVHQRHGLEVSCPPVDVLEWLHQACRQEASSRRWTKRPR